MSAFPSFARCPNGADHAPPQRAATCWSCARAWVRPWCWPAPRAPRSATGCATWSCSTPSPCWTAAWTGERRPAPRPPDPRPVSRPFCRSILLDLERRHPLKLPPSQLYRFAVPDSPDNIVLEERQHANAGAPLIKVRPSLLCGLLSYFHTLAPYFPASARYFLYSHSIMNIWHSTFVTQHLFSGIVTIDI